MAVFGIELAPNYLSSSKDLAILRQTSAWNGKKGFFVKTETDLEVIYVFV